MLNERQKEIVSDLGAVARWIGRKTIKAAKKVGKAVADTYHKVDPDVARHLVQFPLLGFSLFVPKRENIAPGAPDGFPPIVFAHGLGGNRGTFLLMEWYLKLLGRKRAYKISFDESQGMAGMAKEFAAFIERVKTATGESQVEIVAHSMGGVIARLAIDEYNLAESVKTLITLGAPHHGTYAARYANTEITNDLRPGSDMMKRLDSCRKPDSVRFITFWSRNDLIVVPAEYALVEGAEKVDLTPLTHLSYLISPRCWQTVGRFLTS